MKYDVVIIGGGPGGSTVGCFLKKYTPHLKVAIYERERFPRDHVGESQLPAVSYILDEMGCWDKVEAAGFPIKIGATFRWGTTDDLWFFNFLPTEFEEAPRPARFEGQRRSTALQVDRARYDDILLRHAEELGVEVSEETAVTKVNRDGDRVTGLELKDGTLIDSKWYVDATGHVGLLRRAMGVEIEIPTGLQNVAFWDYWQNAEWAETIGRSGTRVQVMSLGYGWIWFIPIGPTRTSVGLVTPADHFKKSGLKPEEMYRQALAEEPRIAALLERAESEGKFQGTKDWSFVAKRQCGENWFLAGESSGFADPILAAGLTITHTAAREVAFSILEIERGEIDGAWIRESYERRLEKRIRNHIRFADYWYSANAQFSELKEFTQQIAKDNGLKMTPEESWRWLAQGGFIDEDLYIGNGGIDINGIRDFAEFLYGGTPETLFAKNNVFRLNLVGAKPYDRAVYTEGRVEKVPCYLRDNRMLPLQGAFYFWMEVLSRDTRLPGIMKMWNMIREHHREDPNFDREIAAQMTSAMEALILDGWVEASYDPALPLMPVSFRHTHHMRVQKK
ncbi:MAG: tryptophan 7-halogenase [Armatimonadetes bacterium]|nr:tryptophan 7-halogenase [Armatimonadota bacterium]